ncbi:MAG TPA: alpha-glucosidase C-terminal domain-containing protein, partial [Longimicrobiales bacterium]|nr:alpha-glucosidase C-terminal domain-containing protein [Longimicrobiales bacterium]
QHQNPASLLWWTRRIIQLRQRHRAFGRGRFRWVEHDNKKVLAFFREYDGETILVVANLSRFSQSVALDLSLRRGSEPVELFGRTPFPVVTSDPYPLTLGPHNFFWFGLRPTGAAEPGEDERRPVREVLPRLRTMERWEDAVRDPGRSRLEDALVPFLARQRWYAGKGREVRQVEVEDAVPIPGGGSADTGEGSVPILLAVCRVEFLEEDDHRYLVPLAWKPPSEVEAHLDRNPGTAVGRLAVRNEGEGLLVDAAGYGGFGPRLLRLIREGRRVQGMGSVLEGARDRPEAFDDEDDGLETRLGSAEQSNTSLVFGSRWILKLLRRLEDGVNLDREVGRYLGARDFQHTPLVAGAVTYRRQAVSAGGRAPVDATAAVLQRFVPNEGDAWEWTL